MATTPTAAIVGAGISGLTAGKMLGDYGIDYTCFESGDRIGGNWAFANPNGHSSAYRSLHIDTSKDLLSFEDYPMPEHFPDFPHHSEIKAYLDGYAETFGLHERIRFETPVEHAERLPGGGWRLRTPRGEELVDVLVVANGHHWNPRTPGFPGTFAGDAIHSHHYLSPTEPLNLKGARILVVGIGNSAADIVSELSQRSHGNEVTLSTRSGAWVMPKYLFGQPIDRIARTLPVVPPAWQRRLVRGLPRLVSGRPEDYGLPRPDHHFLEAHPTVSSELLLRLGSGDAQVRPNVERLDGHTVHFVDGTSGEFDAIIYATGYDISFPFFDEAFLSAPDNHLPLYKRILDPRFDDLLFIGFAQALPTLFPFVENQTRLLGAYLAGLYRPPAPAEMERVILEDQRRYAGHYADRPRHTQQVDYFLYVRDMLRQELPAGRRRVEELGPVPLAGRAAAAAPAPAAT